jgi:predicted O-methyltransferase YrrM
VNLNPEHATSLAEWAHRWVDMAPHIATLTRLATEAQTIVELGVREGVSTWALLDGLPADGRLYSVDVQRDSQPPRVTDDPRWTYIIGDDLSPDVHAQLPGQADLVFIDTSHEYEHTVAELVFALSLSPARIVMHDYVQAPVARAVDEFCAREGWAVVAHEPEYGLATLERHG